MNMPQTVRQVYEYIVCEVEQIVRKYLFDVADRCTKNSIERDIVAYLSSIGRQEDFTVSSRWPCALWGIIDGELINPANPGANPVVMCAGRIYDINNDKFLSGDYDAELVSEIYEVLKDFDIPISSKAPMDKLYVRIYNHIQHYNVVVDIAHTSSSSSSSSSSSTSGCPAP